MPASQPNDFLKIIPTNQDRITNITTENANTLPTQEEVKKEEEEWKTCREVARKKEKDHTRLSWTGCYDDECLVHMGEKDTKGWFPKQPRKQPPTAPHADLPREKCNRWGCQIPAQQTGKSSRTNSARKDGKKAKKSQTDEWLNTEDDDDSTVPDITVNLQPKLTKLIKEQWELKEALKENQVVIEQLKRDLIKERFEVARQQGLTTLAQQSARGAILRHLEFHKNLLEIHDASKPPEKNCNHEIFIASMTWHNA